MAVLLSSFVLSVIHCVWYLLRDIFYLTTYLIYARPVTSYHYRKDVRCHAPAICYCWCAAPIWVTFSPLLFWLLYNYQYWPCFTHSFKNGHFFSKYSDILLYCKVNIDIKKVLNNETYAWETIFPVFWCCIDVCVIYLMVYQLSVINRNLTKITIVQWGAS